jgi:hypothetical protein
MASGHNITLKEVIDRVRMVFPDAPEVYVKHLINDALVEISKYDTNVEHAKVDIVADKMWYTLSDVKIPRNGDGELLRMDATSESSITVN